MSYVQQRTWLTQGPRGLGDGTVQIGFPMVATAVSNDPTLESVGRGDHGSGSPVTLEFPMTSSEPGGSFDPFGFLESSRPVTILQASGPGGSIGSPCFQLAFPWFGSKTAAGTCKPVIDVGPVVGVLVTALVLGTFFFKGVRR